MGLANVRELHRAIHKAAGSLVTDFPKNASGMTPRDHCLIHGSRDGTMEGWNSTRQIMEQPGTVRLAAL